MDVEFSPHALKNMAERQISQERVLGVLRTGTTRPDLNNRKRAEAIVSGLRTTVIFVSEADKTIVITVWDELSVRGSP